jgi:hypothetical protein
MSKLFFVIDNSIPEYPSYELVLGEENVLPYYGKFTIFEIGDIGTLMKLVLNNQVMLLEVSDETTTWIPTK